MLRRMFSALTLFVLISFSWQLGQPLAIAQTDPTFAAPVVVELFTSQGCSSCPPADQLLASIAALHNEHQLPVYCLSFHVDYWNSLGWKDPYSSKQYSDRQRRYSKALSARGIYTPQMIVNGETEFVGSRGGDAKQAIKKALSTNATSTVKLTASLSADNTNTAVEYEVTGNSTGALLNIALVQNSAVNEVPRGENSGRQLTHVGVVRSFQTVALDSQSGKLDIKLPPGLDTQNATIVAFVQNRQSMQISGASVANL